MQQEIVTHLADPRFVAEVVEMLTATEQTALNDILAQGGVMDWSAFAAAYDDDMKERPYLEYHGQSRITVMGRLRVPALVFEGTIDGQVVLTIPLELRPVLAELLSGPPQQALFQRCQPHLDTRSQRRRHLA